MNFILRPFQVSDVDSLVHHANNFKIAKFLTDAFPHPYTVDHAKAFIAMATQDDPVHIFAIDVNGEAVGAIGLHPQKDIMCKNAELGYWLAEPYWEKESLLKQSNKLFQLASAYLILQEFMQDLTEQMQLHSVYWKKRGSNSKQELKKIFLKTANSLMN